MALLTITQGPLTLACMGADAQSTVEGPTLDGRPLLQLIQLPRAAQATVLDRGARVRTLKFRVRAAAAPNACQALFAGLLQEWGLEASAGSPITVRYGGAGGIALTFTDGAVAHTVAHQGRMAIHTYTITAGQLMLQNFDVLNALVVANSLALARIVSQPNGIFWLQLWDTVLLVWSTGWLLNGVFTVGPVGQIGPFVRVNAGQLQIWDTGLTAFRPIWWSSGALQIGPSDGTAGDGNPATAARVVILNGILQLQLLDNAHQPQFATLMLANGALQAGPLMN